MSYSTKRRVGEDVFRLGSDRSIFRRLKYPWTTAHLLKAEYTIVKYIFGYYRQVRPHSPKGGLTPNESEK